MKKVQNHILIVDDDTRICELLEKFLSKNGYLTTSVHSAEKARRLLSGLAFDLIILDDILAQILILKAVKMFTGGGRLFND